MSDGYLLVGSEGFEEQVRMTLDNAITKALGPEKPANVKPRLVKGSARSVLIDASKDADLLVVGRRGHGGFVGLLVGSVSSACVAHAHCPVLVVHAPAKDHKR